MGINDDAKLRQSRLDELDDILFAIRDLQQKAEIDVPLPFDKIEPMTIEKTCAMLGRMKPNDKYDAVMLHKEGK